MSGKTISIIYFYLVSIIGLVLLVIGIFHAVTFGVNNFVYDKYPLRYGGLDRCEEGYDITKPTRIDIPQMVATPSAQEIERQKKLCLQNQEIERQQHKVDDIKNALTFILVGALLFGIHFPIALRRSREK